MDYTIDENLLQGLRDNDDAAFKYLYQTSFITIHSIATNSSRNREDGEDLYNDGIIVLLDRIKKPDFVLNGKIEGLLYAICKKMNSNSLRKEKSKQNYLNGNFDDSHEEYLDEKMDRSLYRSIFRDSLKKLKQDCQKIINKYLEELSLENIAEDLGLTPMYVQKRKRYCQQALLNHIAANSEYISLLNNNEIAETNVLYLK